MRPLFVFLATWSCFCVLTPVQGATPSEAVLPEISAALAAGQYEDVIAVAGTGLAEPGLDDLHRGRMLIVRGLARQALSANDEALADFTQALSIPALTSQDRGRALFARGVSLDSLGRLDDAVGDYTAVLKLTPGATYALNNRANVRRRQGQLDSARRDYLAALNGTNPNPQYPYFGLGQIAEMQGDLEAAHGYYSRALAADPGFAPVLERLQALGTPGDGLSGLTADSGPIVLKPPKAASAIALHPPDRPPEDESLAAVPPRQPRPAAPASPPRASGLRPTIVEGVTHRGGDAQLGSWRSEQEARTGWMMAQAPADGLLDGLTPLIARAEIPGRGVYWRLKVAPPLPVAKFCGAMTQRGLACIPALD